jgi:ABC-2 type transport system permease protein
VEAQRTDSALSSNDISTPESDREALTTEADRRAVRLAELPFERITGRRAGFFRGLTSSVVEVFGQRELIGMLVGRQLKSRYKDSSLGFLWSLIRPLTMLLIYYVAIGQFLGAARGIPQFAIFVFTGLTLWGLFSEIVSSGTNSIVENAGLIKKVYLPREIFPLAAAGSAFVNFSIQFGVLVGAELVLQQFPLSWNLLYVPAAIVVAMIYAVALAILFSALNVYLRDVQYLVEVGTQIFFWASPIVYSWSFVVLAGNKTGLSWLVDVYLLNPVSTAILAFQKGLWAAGSKSTQLGPNLVLPQPWPADLDQRLLVVALVGLVFLAIAQRVFARLQGNFAQEI